MKYLSPDECHPIDILSGAFMFMRRETLDKSGLLDESFFMYGEDIDLSYRLVLAGYTNYFLPTLLYITKERARKKEACDTSVSFMKPCSFFQKALPALQQRVLPRRKILYILPSLVSRCLPSRLLSVS